MPEQLKNRGHDRSFQAKKGKEEIATEREGKKSDFKETSLYAEAGGRSRVSTLEKPGRRPPSERQQ